jgi:hypothetical protein
MYEPQRENDGFDTGLLKAPLQVVLLLVLGIALATAGHARRLVAVGDIHGAHEEFLALLRAVELIDEQDAWIGGDATLVQTGDLFDRGVAVKDVVLTLMRLQGEAERAGGRVVTLLGNHEGMNLLRIPRDLNPETYTTFANKDSRKVRDQAYKDYVAWRKARAKELGEQRPALDAAYEAAWKAARPPGYVEFLQAIGPDGEIGAWLRKRKAIAVIDGIAFLHGGLSPEIPERSIDEINQRVAREVATFDMCVDRLVDNGIAHSTSDAFELVQYGQAELARVLEELNLVSEEKALPLRERVEWLEECDNYNEWYPLAGEGPLWFRGFARWTDEEAAVGLKTLEERFGIRNFVVGHTPQESFRVQVRFDGRVALIDTGMLTEVYGGRASALEIDPGEAPRARYLEGDEELDFRLPEVDRTAPADSASKEGVQWLDRDGNRLPFVSDAQLVEFLERAAVVDEKRLTTGINRPLRVVLAADGVSLRAIFRDVDARKERFRTTDGRKLLMMRDSYRYEVAAYRLDQLLGIGRVPPAALRKHDGVDGSIQLWVENVLTEEGRLAQGYEPPNSFLWAVDRIVMKFFDALIQNIDRNQGNILIAPATGDQYLIDHSRAFLMEEQIPQLEALTQIERSVWQRFKTLEPQQVRDELEGVLLANEVEPLLARWRMIRQHFEQRLADVGEAAVLVARRG